MLDRSPIKWRLHVITAAIDLDLKQQFELINKKK